MHTPANIQDPLFLVVDLFCGAGGTTTGFAMAKDNIAKVIACVNHDPKAIKSHWRNHPEVKHFNEDIRTLDLTELVNLVDYYRKKYPYAKLILWASLECTNFSKAKGGQPRNADSRTLADHLDRYILALYPDYIQIENVVEFMSWGPLDENGKPVSKRNGEDWMRWRREICEMGYYDEWKEMNSANFGSYTSRNRLFGCFAKHSLQIAWPAPTHAKNPSQVVDLFSSSLQKWKAVKEVLNFEDEGKSIFNRKKPLSDKTFARIYAGLIKYVVKGNDFLLKYNSTDKNGKHTPPSLDEPCPTVSCQGRLGLVQSKFLAAYYGNGDNVSSVENPCPTIPTKDRFNLVQPVPFLMPTNFDNKPRSIEVPAPTITANRKYHYIVNPSHGGHCTSTDVPCPVIVARQDKAPLYVVQASCGSYEVPIYEGDSEIVVKIKRFMAACGLIDIKMRMLRVHELLKIQGFPDGYQLEGNRNDQKKFIGNSVEPKVVKAWIEAMAGKIVNQKKVA